VSQEPCAASLVSVHDPVQLEAHQPTVQHQPLPSLLSLQNSLPHSVAHPGQTTCEGKETKVFKKKHFSYVIYITTVPLQN
jgi:hypothetical protein